MAAARHDLIISRGEDFGFVLTIKDGQENIVDVSNDTFSAEIRRGHGDPISATFSTNTENGESGLVSFSLPKSETERLNGKLRYYWDVFWSDESGSTTRLISGSVAVEDNITDI